MAEPPGDDLGGALARTISALERVPLDALQPKERHLLETGLGEAGAAFAECRRAMRIGKPFAQED